MHLLFDLDGTLTDSFPGISLCINHALTELGCDSVADERLRGLVGRPLATIFGVLLATTDPMLLDRATLAYRSRFDAVGIFENRVFPGIAEALEAFLGWGHSLQIVTAKPRVTATRVIEHFSLGGYFQEIHGPELGERSCDKADLVAAALKVAGVTSAHAVMIGDHADDVRAARRNAVRSVGAGWGYGSRAELATAAPDYVAETVEDLVAWIESAG